MSSRPRYSDLCPDAASKCDRLLPAPCAPSSSFSGKSFELVHRGSTLREIRFPQFDDLPWRSAVSESVACVSIATENTAHMDRGALHLAGPKSGAGLWVALSASGIAAGPGFDAACWGLSVRRTAGATAVRSRFLVDSLPVIRGVGKMDAYHGIPFFSTNEDRPRADAEPEQVGAVAIVRYAWGQGDRRAARCEADRRHSRHRVVLHDDRRRLQALAT